MLIRQEKRAVGLHQTAQVYGRNNSQVSVKTKDLQKTSGSKMSLFAGVLQNRRKKASEIRQVILPLALLLLPLNFTPLHVTASSLTVASWYGPGFHGRRTASGERFNQWAMTAAHRSLPFGTLVRVTHKGRSVTVRINDRGPFVRGRSLDLSRGAAQRLRCPGVCRVAMVVVKKRRVR